MELSISELKELMTNNDREQTLTPFINEKVIVRTYSAGVWYGTLKEKAGREVIITDARRMWRWQAAKSISLSGVVAYGIKDEGSKICPAVNAIWLEAIEIIPCTDGAIKSIEAAPDVEAQ